MRNVGHFEKVSFEEFKKRSKEYKLELDDTELIYLYQAFSLPERKTKHSAGYDFHFPYNKIVLQPGEIITFPTGVKAKIKDEWFLGLYPKSGISFNYGIRLIDTISVIDADYFNNIDNEGDIIIKLVNNGSQPFTISRNQCIIQGIFKEYGITDNDNAKDIRTGGLGSTLKPKYKRLNTSE